MSTCLSAASAGARSAAERSVSIDRSVLLRAALILGLGLVASPGLPVAASAATLPTVADVPAACRGISTMDSAVAYACDPANYACDRWKSYCWPVGGGASGVSLMLNGRRQQVLDRLAASRDSEPLQPGETLELRWRKPSARAVLGVSVAGARSPQTVVLALRWRPSWVRVTAHADGSLRVASARRSGVIPPQTWPEVTWRPRSARLAAERIVRALEIQRDISMSLRTLCASLAPGLAELHVRDIEGEPDPCTVSLYFRAVGGENVPHVRSTTHKGTRVRVRGNRAILSTRLTHRYSEDGGDGPPPRTVAARALLVRAADGIWSLATLDPLLGRSALHHVRPYTDAQLARAYARDAALGREEAAARARAKAAFDAATVDATGLEPCQPPLRSDPAGDVMVGGPDLARRPSEHLDVDLVETGLAPGCLAIRTTGPLPARLRLETSTLAIIVRDGRVLVVTTDGDHDELPVAGVAARLEPTRLVVRMPVMLPIGDTLHLWAERGGVEYHDADTSREELYALNERASRGS